MLWAVLAEHSRKGMPTWSAKCLPSSHDTTLLDCSWSLLPSNNSVASEEPYWRGAKKVTTFMWCDDHVLLSRKKNNSALDSTSWTMKDLTITWTLIPNPTISKPKGILANMKKYKVLGNSRWHWRNSWSPYNNQSNLPTLTIPLHLPTSNPGPVLRDFQKTGLRNWINQ